MSKYSIYNPFTSVLNIPNLLRRRSNVVKSETNLPGTALQHIIEPISEVLLEVLLKEQKENSNKGILVLGNAGVGKSTLVSVLSNKKELPGAEENALEENEPFEDIVTGHLLPLQIKIPTKTLAENVTIWELPCFCRVEDPVQEIVNSFYIKEIFKVTEKLKFVLVVPESDLTTKQGSEFVRTISNFMKIFKDVDCIPTSSLCLVVTKISESKSVHHIREILEKILTINKNINEHETELTIKLKELLFLFPKLSEENENDFSEMRKSIIVSENYSEINVNMIGKNVSSSGAYFSNYLFNMTMRRFLQVLHVISSATSSANNCLNINALNVLHTYHSLIKKWVFPAAHYMCCQKHDQSVFFPTLEMLSKLQEVFAHDQLSKTSDAIKIFQQALAILSEYADSDCRTIIQDYSNCLQQQYQLLAHFPTICENELPDLILLVDLISTCREKTIKIIQRAITDLCVDITKIDEAYFKEAIQYLMIYSESETCKKQIAIAYKCLASIAEAMNENGALIYYVKSLKFDKHQANIYETLGRLLKKIGQYSKAIECYKIINNHFMIHLCFKEWFRREGNNYRIILQQAEYFGSVGLFEGARESYFIASGLTTDDDSKATILEMARRMLSERENLKRGYIRKSVEYDFSKVDEPFFSDLLTET